MILPLYQGTRSVEVLDAMRRAFMAFERANRLDVAVKLVFTRASVYGMGTPDMPSHQERREPLPTGYRFGDAADSAALKAETTWQTEMERRLVRAIRASKSFNSPEGQTAA